MPVIQYFLIKSVMNTRTISKIPQSFEVTAGFLYIQGLDF